MNIIEQAITCVRIEGHGYVFAKRFLDTAEKLTEAQAEIDRWIELCKVHDEISTILEADLKELSSATIDFIDQMRVQGCEGYTLPAEYDTLVDVVKKYRVG